MTQVSCEVRLEARTLGVACVIEPDLVADPCCELAREAVVSVTVLMCVIVVGTVIDQTKKHEDNNGLREIVHRQRPYARAWESFTFVETPSWMEREAR